MKNTEITVGMVEKAADLRRRKASFITVIKKIISDKMLKGDF
jgi:hypothetical protein